MPGFAGSGLAVAAAGWVCVSCGLSVSGFTAAGAGASVAKAAGYADAAMIAGCGAGTATCPAGFGVELAGFTPA